MFLGPNVRVDDGLLSPDLQERLAQAVAWMPLHFLNRWDRFRSHELDMHWYYPIAFSDQPYEANVEPDLRALDGELQSIAECWEAVKTALPGTARLYECMLSANTFGTEGRVHQDIAEAGSRANHTTVLVYCNREWNVSWAGETIFFDDRSEITGAVLPRPGRVAIIDGDPPHVGRSVSRICPTDRRVLVFKLWRN
ncbi:MAG TPA: 2OG-Fe(II) oxygenase [Ramlibacter sp.]|jgi:SM-20-related protein|uniref:2OG-Fe(II) oxygenase n=1 Tax=Ramlibacter sp. TaxID=1917967 RepID=UPI002D6FC504|nr:2OG-Fe(II) oxygenase [Ramlibacter sp.]HZY18323.1 2OG-Fe(II) oxygenase [Ramlibacter sp.]